MSNDKTDPEILRLNTPGVVIEVNRRTAEDLGAFEEDALSEAEALASGEDYDEPEGAK